MRRSICRAVYILAVVAITFTVASLAALPEARANKDEALKILKAMSTYVGSQKTLSVEFDASIEVITPELEKLQYNNSGRVLLTRPDKLRATRVGGYADVELIFDGKTATLLGKHTNAFAQIEAPGSTDQLFDRLRLEHSMQLPAADLLLTNAFDVLTKDVLYAKHIGAGVVGGLECEHLAFRNDETDWQLWVQVGPQPIPRKLVITSKAVTGAPQYTLVVRDWKTDVQANAETFNFKAPAGATKVAIGELNDVDEVPAGLVPGGK